jgi:serine/threonine protein kinase
MRADGDRWVEVTPSSYAHERAGLAYVRDRLPDTDPYRAWANLEFITDQGRPLEIDLLVLGPAGFTLVELKYWAGPIGGDRYRLVRGAQGDTFDNPIRLANSKARILRGQLLAAYERITKKAGRLVPLIPWVEPAIFFHHHDFTVAMDPSEEQGLFGPDEASAETRLPGIIGFLTREPSGSARRVDARQSELLRNLLKKEGMGRITRREVGAYVLDARPADSGRSWQDYLATHTRFKDDRRRIRIYNVGRATSADQEASLVRAAEREYRLLSHIDHPGLLAPVEYTDSRMGPALMYPYDPAARRLDLLLASPDRRLTYSEQLALVRTVAETLSYAHGRHVMHRGLSPRCIYVRLPGPSRRQLTAQIADWQTGAHLPSTSSDSPTLPSVFRGTRNPADLYDAQTEIYQAPEAATGRAPDEVRIDVFSLGAVSYLVITGQQPAPDVVSLYRRLEADGGLDLAGQVDGVVDALRDLVLDATRGEPTRRLRDVDAFLERLAEVERLNSDPEPVAEPDPLDPPPDAVLRERWKVLRRLGGGSSAVAILAEDLESGERDRHVVLKVAREGENPARLREEAEILRRLDDQHIAGLRVPEPVLLERDRTALVLEYAGDQTLARTLREGRLSVDRLERWGQDVFEAVAYLESVRVPHRDIKPANLGIRPRPADRALHLVLFDFSLSRTSATDLQAGTPMYLDPFLGTGPRQRWDDHAERYAVAVTLFEMATGRTPTYGPGDPHPAVVEHEATIEAAMFDPAVAAHLVPFFRRALRRDARERYQTTEEMARAWQGVFTAAAQAVPDADTLAARATLTTTLAQSGLSVRAQSALEALEPLNVVTVEGLLQIPVARLRNLAGVNDSTRRELSARARQWRSLLRQAQTSGEPGTQARSIDSVIDALIPGVRRTDSIARAARLLLGRPQQSPGDVPAPWLTPRDLASQLELTPARCSQLIVELRGKWGRSQVLAAVRDDLVDIVESLGGVATGEEAAEALLVRRGSTAADPLRRSQGLGLTRAAIEAELEQGGQTRLDMRRAGSTMLIAREPDEQAGGVPAARSLDHVVAAGRAVQALTADAEAPVPAPVAVEQLLALAAPVGMPPIDGRRLLRLAAATSDEVAVSTRDELYRRGLGAASALRHSGAVFAMTGARFTPDELRDRVRARFPEAEPLPDRPELDLLVRDIDAQFVWDRREYRAPTVPDDTLSSKLTTGVGAGPRPGAVAIDIDRRLRDSIDQCGFLALGVARSDLDAARDRLAERYGLAVVEVSALLMDRMREVAAEHGIPWQAVLEADAAEPHTQEGEGLRTLVRRSLTAVREGIVGADRPVLVTEPALLARYGHLDLIGGLADQTERRSHAVWLLTATSSAEAGPTVDRRPVPIVAASQWLRLPEIAYQPQPSMEETPS